MRYGFVIDQDRCIGCHACTVACKEEHQVPVGVFRTWVKYIEKGQFPHTSRHFGVMRCNHCDSAPCTEICPTHALYRRSDGIIDFDNRRCIGCKGCMQACPYDALYIDPNTNTAAKCNFCAHRVENNLEPACVIVCPTQAILAGDLDDPASKVSRVVATEKVSIRKPEKGTEPKLYYKGIEGDLLQPTRLSRQNTYVFAEQRDQRPQQEKFDPSLTREVYDVAHPAAWGWKIAAYLWTKSIAAGVMMMAGILYAGFPNPFGDIACPIIALLAMALTMLLLVFDLKRPDRFFYLLTKPNFRSWLVLGAYVLMAYGACVSAWLLFGILAAAVPAFLVIVTVLLAIASACYSAFLFAQAKGRDLWQSTLFIFHLLLQAVIAGSAVIALLALAAPRLIIARSPEYTWDAIVRNMSGLLLMSAILSLLLILAEVFLPHRSADVATATQTLVRGRLSKSFWGLAIGAGLVLPILLLMFTPESYKFVGIATTAASVLALYGLWWFEKLWVEAGQSVPLS